MKKWQKLTIASALLVALFVVLTGCGNQAQTSSVSTEGEMTKIVVGTEATYYPFEWRDAQGNIVGFDIDLINAIGEEMGVEVEVRNIPFDSLIQSLQNGNIDVIASAMTITERRQETVDFSKPYYESVQAIVVPTGSDITTAADLTDKKVGVQNGTTGSQVAADLLGERNSNINRFDTIANAFNSQIIGQVDAVITDKPVAERFIANNPNSNLTIIVDESFEAEYFGLAVRKTNPELLAKINEALEKLEQNGTIAQLLDTHMGS
ncbi:basic amino acid ABC transporter substrate-binding protein [Heliorestis convoluta]|uniref:Basic amino acid ABC transporter, substrate-binding protein n=1 Tax=Heliorestis convoluta TaxID=356322 RepID=A0A5Q2N9T4_9FIRM|nr:basic amino acid ABC transporter substrate-binding protein [Heliorestis convoluta]QGG49245.1 basic amino acid ABC transporter, substrate-binding protein [Heliorestis convoluta]